MKQITILIPIYNEEESLPLLKNRILSVIEKIPEYEFDILFVNDGSKDKSLEIIKEYRSEDKRFGYVNLARNFGKEVAMLAGLDYSKGDAVIIMDADLQDPPELIPELIHYWEEGYDDVYAQRTSREGETFLKKWTSKMYYKVLQKIAKIPVQKDTGDFRLLDRRCVNAICKLREEGRCSKSIFSWIGYNKKAVTFVREPRVAGKTKWNYKKLIDLAIDGITSLSISPLRYATYVSIPIFLITMFYGIYVIVNSIIIHAFPQIVQVILFIVLLFGGIQTLLIGIAGEYIGRTFKNSQKRPIYLIDSVNENREMNGEKNNEEEINYTRSINSYYHNTSNH